jgi:hypothetical protein
MEREGNTPAFIGCYFFGVSARMSGEQAASRREWCRELYVQTTMHMYSLSIALHIVHLHNFDKRWATDLI